MKNTINRALHIGIYNNKGFITLKNLLYKKPHFLAKIHVFPLITHEPRRVRPWELNCIIHH